MYSSGPPRPAPAVNGHLLQTDTFTMYQLLCHVNVPVPADTCLTRTVDRAILAFVPGMKRTVVITIKYYDNFNDFGTSLLVRYLVLFTIPNREAETVAIFNAKPPNTTSRHVSCRVCVRACVRATSIQIALNVGLDA